MRLYYLTSERWAKVILQEKRLKLSTFKELNDPFELLGAATGEKEIRRVVKILRTHWEGRLGILCTTRTWENPVMWAHYGDKHRGICLGFDVPDDLPREMVYVPERLRNLLDSTKPLMGFNQDTLLTFLTMKFQDWTYEKEWRLFSQLDEKDPKTGLYYVSFNQDVLLKEVIIGHRCTLAVGAAAKLVGDVSSIVQVIKARPAFDSYKIVRQKAVKAIIVKPK